MLFSLVDLIHVWPTSACINQIFVLTVESPIKRTKEYDPFLLKFAMSKSSMISCRRLTVDFCGCMDLMTASIARGGGCFDLDHRWPPQPRSPMAASTSITDGRLDLDYRWPPQPRSSELRPVQQLSMAIRICSTKYYYTDGTCFIKKRQTTLNFVAH